jgi:hypothetical protein
MHTPSSVIKTRVYARRAHFARRGYTAVVELPGQLLAEQHFYGDDGRKVRSEAIEWAHKEGERQAKIKNTAWRDVRDSKRAPWV